MKYLFLDPEDSAKSILCTSRFASYGYLLRITKSLVAQSSLMHVMLGFPASFKITRELPDYYVLSMSRLPSELIVANILKDKRQSEQSWM